MLAVVRTPQKLRDMLTKDHELPTAAMDNLNILQGNCTETSAVKKTLAPSGSSASLIVVGVGATPSMQMSLTNPVVVDQPNICENTAKAIFAALRELRQEGVISDTQKPTLLCISTTGATVERDVPIELNWLYHYLLSEPHKDKALMEELVAKTSMETGPDAPIDGFVFIRPSLLMDGESQGMSAIRVGWVEHKDAIGASGGDAPGPAIGRTIRRVDVGLWIYENAIRNTSEWKGKCVTLTY